MDPDQRQEADELLDRALADTGAHDPREPYRALLRELKKRDQERYSRAVDRFQGSVLPSIVQGDTNPLQAWLEYGRHLANQLDPGRDVVIDHSGKASTLTLPPSWRDLIIHLPDDGRARAVLVSLPPDPTPAQRATVDLLVHARVMLDA